MLFYNTFVERWFLIMKRNLAYARAFRELSYLNDRELADIGLCRSELHDVVYGSVIKRLPSQAFG